VSDSKAKAKRRGEFPPLPEPLPVPCVDNHTHLESINSKGLFSGEDHGFAAADEQLKLAAAAGVDRIVQVGCDIPSARWTDAWLRSLGASVVSRQPEGLPQPTAEAVGAVAIHPNEAVRHARVYEIAKDGLAPHDEPHHLISLPDAIAEIAEIAKNNPKIKAIGETGMDLFRGGLKGADAQRESFRAHIALAKELNLALQIHDREAHQEVIEILLKDGAPEKTVFHCFSGDAEMASILAKQGWYLSFAGPVTYKANDDLRAALNVAPLELVLAETDAPYLTPHPYRGQPNAPYVVNYTIRAMADIKGIPLEVMCQKISENCERVYGDFG
jgi:TatD DNase family protein